MEIYGILFYLAAIFVMILLATIRILYKNNKWLNYQVSQLRNKQDVIPDPDYTRHITLIRSENGNK